MALSLLSCKKDEKKEGGLGSTIESVSNLNKIANKMEDVQKNIDELKAKTPVSNDELKTVIPETLAGLKRTEITVGGMSTMNLSSAEAQFSNEQKNIKLNIIDGAGEAGSGVVSIFMLTLNADMEKTTENGFEKTATVNGQKSFVSENKNGESLDSEIKFIAKNRYMIDASADGISSEELGKALAEINFSKLP